MWDLPVQLHCRWTEIWRSWPGLMSILIETLEQYLFTSANRPLSNFLCNFSKRSVSRDSAKFRCLTIDCSLTRLRAQRWWRGDEDWSRLVACKSISPCCPPPPRRWSTGKTHLACLRASLASSTLLHTATLSQREGEAMCTTEIHDY